jgi:MFS family permease
MRRVRNPHGAPWLSLSVIALASASLFSDIGHEMATAVLPMFIGTMGLGAAALGVIEGVADFLNSMAKLGGGYLGQRLSRKKSIAAFGYLITALSTAALSWGRGFWAFLTLRSVAWIGRGYRAPLRDFLMSDAVPPTHYGRAFGLERAGDMIGAVAGPLTAALLIGLGLGYRQIFAWALIPGILAASSVFFFVREKPHHPGTPVTLQDIHARFPRGFGRLLAAILTFGMGDFSRTFLILVAARRFGAGASLRTGGLFLSLPILLYVLHNAVSAFATVPAGRAGDRWSKKHVLTLGYGLGTVCNLLLCARFGSRVSLALIFALSGIYIAIEDTIEKAYVSELLPRSVRSYGLGLLATANAIGDMLSSLYVGILWDWAGPSWAFGLAAGFSLAGFILVAALPTRGEAGRGLEES